MVTLPERPKIPTGRELYDSIMSGIEPELVSSVIPTLQEKYKEETPEGKEARKDRYNQAFAEYEKQYQQYVAELEEQVKRYQREGMKSVEAMSREEEEQNLASIEDAINAA